jgi:putative ABC transport system permease protein
MDELTEACRIALAQIRAHKLRSVLTALGVIIGITAVTLMGAAIHGMDVSFDRSLSLLGNNVLYLDKWPWFNAMDWWNYVNRPAIRPENAAALNRIFAQTPDSNLEVAAPVCVYQVAVSAGPKQVSGVFLDGTTYLFSSLLTDDFSAGRFFTAEESDAGRQVVVVGADVADALALPGQPALGRILSLGGQPFRVIGVLARQGPFLGRFSYDNQAFLPLPAARKYFGTPRGGATGIRVKVRDENRLDEATDELIGAMRRVRGQLPGERDNFSINQQQAYKSTLDPIKHGIAIVGLFITGLALFVGAIGIMNITFVSVKERTREIGTRKALGARRRTILLQFLIEAVSICLIGGILGVAATTGLAVFVGHSLPQLPLALSPALIVVSMLVSVLTGVFAGFAPAWGASRLDPVDALRYE